MPQSSFVKSFIFVISLLQLISRSDVLGCTLLAQAASMDSNEQLVTVNREQAEWEERPLSDLFNNEKR